MKPALRLFSRGNFHKNRGKRQKSVDNFCGNGYNIDDKQVSPSGMAAASQAVPGEFDSRHLLQKEKTSLVGRFSFWKIEFLLTRVEGGAASGNERFALRSLV